MKIPYYKQQTDYTCGPAAMRMVLASLGIKKTERALAKSMETHRAPYGTGNKNFPQLAETLKLNYHVSRNSSLAELKKYLQGDFRVIVGYFYEADSIGHYAVIKKIDKKNIYLADPELGPKTHYTVNYFKRVWHNDPRGDNEKRWFIAIKR